MPVRWLTCAMDMCFRLSESARSTASPRASAVTKSGSSLNRAMVSAATASGSANEGGNGAFASSAGATTRFGLGLGIFVSRWNGLRYSGRRHGKN